MTARNYVAIGNNDKEIVNAIYESVKDRSNYNGTLDKEKKVHIHGNVDFVGYLLTSSDIEGHTDTENLQLLELSEKAHDVYNVVKEHYVEIDEDDIKLITGIMSC